MVSKRQKQATKRFKEVNIDLFPKPSEPSSAAGDQKRDQKKKSRKLRALKAKKTIGTKKDKTGGGGGGSSASGRSKHPLRVPGMRPGESCFICKSGDHIARLCPEKAHWEKNKICLLCRQRGHSLKNCPEKSDKDNKKFCYNCGEVGHSLFRCPQPIQDGGTRFALCFICKEHGHLSKDCPNNARGVYPKGGSCKVCGEVTHLAKFCPNKGKKDLVTSTGQLNSTENTEHSHQVNRHIRLSGDDLEDDFMEEPVASGEIYASSNSNSLSTTRKGKIENKMHEKPKRKQGPKVVNFLA